MVLRHQRDVTRRLVQATGAGGCRNDAGDDERRRQKPKLEGIDPCAALVVAAGGGCWCEAAAARDRRRGHPAVAVGWVGGRGELHGEGMGWASFDLEEIKT